MGDTRKISYPSPEYRRRRDYQFAPRIAWPGPRRTGSSPLAGPDPAADDRDRCRCEPVEQDRRDEPEDVQDDSAGAEEEIACRCEPHGRERDPRVSTRTTVRQDEDGVCIADSVVEVEQDDDRCGCEESAVEVGRSNPRKRSPRTTFPAGDIVETAEPTNSCEDGGGNE